MGNIIGKKWFQITELFDDQHPDFYINDEMDFGSAIMNDFVVAYGYKQGTIHTFASRGSYDRDKQIQNCRKTTKFLFGATLEVSKSAVVHLTTHLARKT